MSTERDKKYTSPFFPNGIAPDLLQSLLASVRRQNLLEKRLQFADSPLATYCENEDRIVSFNLNSVASKIGAQELFKMLYGFGYLGKGDLSLIDVGGGTGGFLTTFINLIGNSNVKPTLTSLIDFFPNQGIDVPSEVKFEKICAELPPKRLYQAFDVVASVNGPLVWSENPEVVLDNLLNMVRPGGCLFISVSPNLHHESFDPTRILVSNPRVETDIPLVVRGGNSDNFLIYNFSFIK